jgi:hypothetical protein
VRLLPEPSHPDLLAEVELLPSAPSASDGVTDLYGEIWSRHTSRVPFTDRRIPDAVRDELTSAAWSERVLLRWPDTDGARRLLALGREAELRNTADPARVLESRSWVRPAAAAGYGIPPEAFGPRDA